MSQKRYMVELTTEERSQLKKMIHDAQMLLKLNEGPGGPGLEGCSSGRSVRRHRS